MINKKTLLLGSAAALFVTGVQAADMPKAPAREPVYRCDITGFIELPGTDVCFKVGGRARFVMTAGEDQFGGALGGSPFFRAGSLIQNSHSVLDTFAMYSTGRLNFDARTSTEYGTVRGFIELEAGDNDARTGGALNLRHAFVQFGNWTFGKTWSTWLNFGSSPGYGDPYLVVGDVALRKNQIRYTFSAGNGLSIAIAIEDPNYVAVTDVNGLAVNSRNEVPDPVIALTYDADWGMFHAAAAAHQNVFTSIATGVTDREWGIALTAGIGVNIGDNGDRFTLKGIYTDGAPHYNHDFFGFFLAGSGGVAFSNAAPVTPAILDTVEKWSVLASYQHFWNPSLDTTVGVGYGEASVLTYSNEQLQVFVSTNWSPVSRVSFGVDVHYFSIEESFAGVLPVPGVTSNDEDGIAASFQVSRTW